MENNSIKIILPPHLRPEDLKDLLLKSSPQEVDLKLSFQDPAITGIATEMVRGYDEMYTALMEEVELLLDAQYGGD